MIIKDRLILSGIEEIRVKYDKNAISYLPMINLYMSYSGVNVF